MAPMTVQTVRIGQVVRVRSSVQLTIELVKVMRHALPDGTTMVLFLEQAHLLSLALIVLEDQRDGNEEAWRDDGEGSNRPTPCAACEIGLRGQGSRERGDDEGSGDKSPGQCAVLQPGGIGDEYVEDEVDGVVADPVPKHTVEG